MTPILLVHDCSGRLILSILLSIMLHVLPMLLHSRLLSILDLLRLNPPLIPVLLLIIRRVLHVLPVLQLRDRVERRHALVRVVDVMLRHVDRMAHELLVLSAVHDRRERDWDLWLYLRVNNMLLYLLLPRFSLLHHVLCIELEPLPELDHQVSPLLAVHDELVQESTGVRRVVVVFRVAVLRVEVRGGVVDQAFLDQHCSRFGVAAGHVEPPCAADGDNAEGLVWAEGDGVGRGRAGLVDREGLGEVVVRGRGGRVLNRRCLLQVLLKLRRC